MPFPTNAVAEATSVHNEYEAEQVPKPKRKHRYGRVAGETHQGIGIEVDDALTIAEQVDI